ncbi:MAG: SIR2 family protein [Amedibacillus dolichus]|uniref:SIR2 family protein n=4 Tax=Amedibacillus dolichus TaxID=31971 RepID=A0A942W9Y4_9FIRM|nr:SIR2 family protein [Amedibacillus dolichus]MBS4883490.1 SIR2 family protein [Amedibacillus dolichus]CDE23206.1 putative lipoprotein [Amedibacillus dolichus CAG:375]
MNEKMSDIKKFIQSFFDQGTVTIVGSGLSCAEGISGMWTLSQKLLNEVPPRINKESIVCWNSIENDLKSGKDLETTLQENKVSNDVEKAILEVTYDLISNEDFIVFKEIVEKNRELKFSKYLSCFNIELYNLVVITTNYDLLIEYACESKGCAYSDSFIGKIISRFSPENSHKEMIRNVKRGNKNINVLRPHIKIYKPHGSINWKVINGELNKINHIECGTPCIITPGSNKYEKGYEIPFDYHIGKMGHEIDNAQKLVFIGYGFNDSHLETHLSEQSNRNKPKLIITRKLSDNARKIVDSFPNTIAIEERELNNNGCGSIIYYDKETYEIEGKNIWDIAELIEEVF